MPLNVGLRLQANFLFASRRKSVSLNPFPVTDLRPDVELMYLMRISRHYRHKGCRKWCRAPEMTASMHGCAEFKYDVTTSDFKPEVVIWSKLRMLSKNYQKIRPHTMHLNAVHFERDLQQNPQCH